MITLEYEPFLPGDCLHAQFPGRTGPAGLRMKWEEDFLAYLKTLEEKKPVAVCGDLNVAHCEIDLKNPKPTGRMPALQIRNEKNFPGLLDSGFIDTYRFLYPEKIEYSWWSYRFRAREEERRLAD